MYDLLRHREPDRNIVLEFISKHPFALLCGSNQTYQPVATQLPLFIEERNGKLIMFGHIMNHMDHDKAFRVNQNVLAVFTGPHCYVSGTWYKNPYTPSTWNYMSAHVSGKIRFLDKDGLIEILRKTTLYFENGNTSSSTIYDNLPESLTQPLLDIISGFEIEVDSIKSVFKLSQDRDQVSYRNIIEHLRSGGYDENLIAEEMELRFNKVFDGE